MIINYLDNIPSSFFYIVFFLLIVKAFKPKYFSTILPPVASERE